MHYMLLSEEQENVMWKLTSGLFCNLPWKWQNFLRETFQAGDMPNHLTITVRVLYTSERTASISEQKNWETSDMLRTYSRKRWDLTTVLTPWIKSFMWHLLPYFAYLNKMQQRIAKIPKIYESLLESINNDKNTAIPLPLSSAHELLQLVSQR